MSKVGELAKKGTWSVALAVDPPRADLVPDQTFLNTIAGNPNYTGWPIWMDTRGFTDRKARPKVVEGAWESFVLSTGDDWSNHVDFARFDPKGEFILVRVLQDDITTKVPPGKFLDPILVVLRVAEAIAVGLTFVKELDWNLEKTKLGFSFKWTRLRGRELSSWAGPQVTLSPGRFAHDDEANSFVEVPANTPVSAIAPYVHQATRNLFVLFDGFTFPLESLRKWVDRLIERKL